MFFKLFAVKFLVKDRKTGEMTAEADVYARDEVHARWLIERYYPLPATVDIQSLKDRGIIEKARYPGVIVGKVTLGRW